MNQEQYIEHEVRLRVMKEVNEEKFKFLETSINKLDNKFNWLFLFIISSVIAPIIMHHYHWI